MRAAAIVRGSGIALGVRRGVRSSVEPRRIAGGVGRRVGRRVGAAAVLVVEFGRIAPRRFAWAHEKTPRRNDPAAGLVFVELWGRVKAVG